MINQIDATPHREGWGLVYQSGVLASETWTGGGLIFSLSGNENFRGPCLWSDIRDNDISTLPDVVLIAFVDAVIAFLRNGQNVLIHCNEGKYRSTYLDVAVHMAMGLYFGEAWLLVKSRHPIAELRAGTAAQLRRMEIQLMGINDETCTCHTDTLRSA